MICFLPVRFTLPVIGKELAIKELTEPEDGIRLSYEDFLNNPMRAER